jgi:arginase
MKHNNLAIIGAPSSAGAYGPGQEKAPDALRASGLMQYLEGHHINVVDKNNVIGFRWQADKSNTKAMNANQVADVARALSDKVYTSFCEGEKMLILGGDCSIELGVVSGCLRATENLGLLYIDLDTDLNTPRSTEDGAFDWMGVAHMLNIEGTVNELAALGPKIPMLHPDQVYYYGAGNVEDSEQAIIHKYNIQVTSEQETILDPAGTAKKIIAGWAHRFDHLLLHLDVDVLDYIDMPLAENYRRNRGLKFHQLMMALKVFLEAPNWSVLTITELNPDHGAADGSTLRIFSESLAEVISSSFNRT